MESESVLLNTQETLPLRRGVRYIDASPEKEPDDSILLNNMFPGIAKRGIDILFSTAVILLVLSWLTPLMALLIRLDSRGPVFFIQKRNGKNGKLFTCIKFRSMIVNDESDLKPVVENDIRVTRIGKILRSYRVDELPQFLNVFWGDMSLVGPRPHMIRENKIYEKLVHNYSFRYSVKPGITGLGQINDYAVRSSLQKMQNRAYWDVVYIKNWSPLLDARILYRTLILCLHNE